MGRSGSWRGGSWRSAWRRACRWKRSASSSPSTPPRQLLAAAWKPSDASAHGRPAIPSRWRNCASAMVGFSSRSRDGGTTAARGVELKRPVGGDRSSSGSWSKRPEVAAPFADIHAAYGSLQFHHLDPATKEFHLGHGGHTRALSRSRVEAEKCALLCANCHAEVEAGLTTMPVDSKPES